MEKKGQITLFIIIGIVMFTAAMFIFFYMNMDSEPEENFLEGDNEVMQSFISTCLAKVAKDGIYFNSMQGGYYNSPKGSSEYYELKIPYYWHDGQSHIPEKNLLLTELSEYIKNNMDNCTENFKPFKDVGFEVDEGGMEVKASFTEDGVLVDMDFAVNARRGEDSYSFKQFNVLVPIDLEEIYNTVYEILIEQDKTPDSIPIGYLSALADERGFTYQYFDMPEFGKTLYSLIYAQYDEPLIFAYLSLYDWTDIESEFVPLSIEHMDEFVIDHDMIFSHQVKASAENVTFYDYTEIFDIDQETGWISFDTSEIPNGQKNVLIKVIDEDGDEAMAFMRFRFQSPGQMPIMQAIPNQTAYVGQTFTYDVNAADPTVEYLYYLDDTTLFDINVMTGMIGFTPVHPGNYSIKIVAVNSAGSSYEMMHLEVI